MQREPRYAIFIAARTGHRTGRAARGSRALNHTKETLGQRNANKV
jgi:hypothetical protein